MLISIILLIFAFINKAICDVLNSRYNHSIFKNLNPNYFNPTVSWKNKYKDGDYTKGAKFFGSTTFFVMFTDFWHLSNFLMTISFILSLTLNVYYIPYFSTIVDSILIYVLYGIVFQLFYAKLLIKK